MRLILSMFAYTQHKDDIVVIGHPLTFVYMLPICTCGFSCFPMQIQSRGKSKTSTTLSYALWIWSSQLHWDEICSARIEDGTDRAAHEIFIC